MFNGNETIVRQRFRKFFFQMNADVMQIITYNFPITK